VIRPHASRPLTSSSRECCLACCSAGDALVWSNVVACRTSYSKTERSSTFRPGWIDGGPENGSDDGHGYPNEMGRGSRIWKKEKLMRDCLVVKAT